VYRNNIPDFALSKESNIYLIKYRRDPNIQPSVILHSILSYSHMTCCLWFCTSSVCILAQSTSTPIDLFVSGSHTTVDVTLFICISDLCLYCTYSTEIVCILFQFHFPINVIVLFEEHDKWWEKRSGSFCSTRPWSFNF